MALTFNKMVDLTVVFGIKGKFKSWCLGQFLFDIYVCFGLGCVEVCFITDCKGKMELGAL